MEKRLLIVDDEEPILFAMREYFEGSGYAVDCAHDERSAGTYLAAGEYAVLIVDLRLSGFDGEEGLEIIERVRQISPTTRTIMLTAYGSPQVEARARLLGADAFLQKPMPLAKIAEVVVALIEKMKFKTAGWKRDKR
ncbi:MAG: response regulator [Burkholderiales bacterium]